MQSHRQVTFQLFSFQLLFCPRRVCRGIFFLWLALTAAHAQTTIVAARTDDEVVLAADSRGTAVENPRRAAPICKIAVCGEMYVGVAGFYQISVNGVSFDAPQLLAQACRSGASRRDNIANVERLAARSLTRFLQAAQRWEPQYYAEQIRARAGLNLVFIGVENQTPFIVVRDFMLPSSPAGLAEVRLKRSDRLTAIPHEQLDYVFAGHHQEITELAGTRKDFWKNGLAGGARFLVEYMISARPDVVGPPVDIVRIDRTGVQWIQRKPQCQDGK